METPLDDFHQYKLEKEQWVTGHTGSSTLEVVEVNVVCLVSYWAWLAWKTYRDNGRLPQPEQRSLSSFMATYGFFIVPLILSCTNIPYRLPLMGAMVALGAVFFAGIQPRSAEDLHRDSDDLKIDTAALPPRRAYISVYRSVLMIMTCVCILAVDFPIFPRSYAKVETYGTSLMDIGVGSFVFSAGIVGARAYLPGNHREANKSFATKLAESLKMSLALFVLGIGRMLSVKGAEYQEHVSEYGVHWNFFFTLGLLPVSICLCQVLWPSPAVTGSVLALGYQLALTYGGWEEFVLHAPRVDLLSMNKEGILGFIGYLSISLLAIALGRLLLVSDPKAGNNLRRPLMLMALGGGIWCVFLVVESWIGIPVSRRLVNLPYILWTVSFNFPFVVGFALIEYLVNWKAGITRIPDHDTNIPWGLSNFNRFGLSTFLVANILTGLVNFSIKTLYASDVQSLAILLAYMLVVFIYVTLRAVWA
ncbi:Glucosaminyl phosphatidylinositol (GlcN-PI) nositol acylation protein [Dimargaris cristalligena]|uniref:GPI-anchored wall transfer protein n=1 Tax=Dimargaris cristalligena TaxID=215637 RepID=A0A4P9ZY91_9FUNG|nr:Glucosaminyl phosphatidylinositol (GlcN-PI) nositol acylation protein [Dimargaris cristalligena]RKP38715.1 GWT1-domain-containing protein [Dimargaris cristalligena]|eukprot:RKP38715.1 GWT1-domain-containing protein [Dimargaris cristalligena]